MTNGTTDPTDSPCEGASSPSQERKVVYSKDKPRRKKSFFGRALKHTEPAENDHLGTSTPKGSPKVPRFKANKNKKHTQRPDSSHSPVEEMDTPIPTPPLLMSRMPDEQEQPDKLDKQDQPVKQESRKVEAVKSKSKSEPSTPIILRKQDNTKGDEWEIIQLPASMASATKPSPQTPVGTKPSLDFLLPSEEEFFAVQEMVACVLGQWLCVATSGGSVLAFSFQLDDSETTPQVRPSDLHCVEILENAAPPV